MPQHKIKHGIGIECEFCVYFNLSQYMMDHKLSYKNYLNIPEYNSNFPILCAVPSIIDYNNEIENGVLSVLDIFNSDINYDINISNIKNILYKYIYYEYYSKNELDYFNQKYPDVINPNYIDVINTIDQMLHDTEHDNIQRIKIIQRIKKHLIVSKLSIDSSSMSNTIKHIHNNVDKYIKQLEELYNVFPINTQIDDINLFIELKNKYDNYISFRLLYTMSTIRDMVKI